MLSWRICLCLLIVSAEAKKGFGPIDQEWAYVQVRPKAHMFWWLYQSSPDKPLVIWIQGGPGVSGTGFGNFEEIGPLDAQLRPRNHSWVKDYNVLFIDNPVGTGFSYVEDLSLLATNNRQIAKDLFTCVRSFFQTFTKFGETPTYILAESYGGKMTVEFANLWYRDQVKGNIKSNLKGIGLVDSLISPVDMHKSLAPYLFNFGMIDRDGYEAIDNAADRFADAIQQAQWLNATNISIEIEYLMQKYTYSVDRLYILKKVQPNYYPQLRSFSNLSRGLYSNDLKRTMQKVQSTLGLKSVWGNQEPYVFNALYRDCRKPVVRHVEKLLNETDLKVYIFNGQLDLIINTPGTLSWIEKLDWKNSKNWLNAPRYPLVIDNVIEGYSKAYGNLKFFWVVRSGHMIPADNPVAMNKILRDLIHDES
ncbi:retinoid-inducible serine carboxypeptidase-like [Trichogramma pretiosum]|uniref:retinoid-inducible serine carboxypeptidase-like n=1 Tax=Trichogramma pretiosum TaxID=7493 RepID=UPI0006C97C19|nr:retinoid-inducible serine carboxypeptidase-like [Trichogramma pretiosum]